MHASDLQARKSRYPNGVPILGIVGGIGAGKSVVAAEFAAAGCLINDSDADAKAMLLEVKVRDQLVAWWGSELLDDAGQVDRRKLADIIFASATDKARLESLVYPLIAARRGDIILAGAADPAVPAVVLDSPLLIEAHLDQLCDLIIFVEADGSLRQQRLVNSRGWDSKEIKRREQWQLPVAEKRARADEIIVNEGDREDLRQRVHEILTRL